MKKTTFIFGLVMMGLAVSSFALKADKSIAKETTKEATAKASIKWESKTQDAGQIEQGKPVTLTFEFTNTGDVPLTILKVKPTCGCTVASYPKEPILPGETKEIKTTYNAANKGKFKKSITVTSNAEVTTQVLYISGEVI